MHTVAQTQTRMQKWLLFGFGWVLIHLTVVIMFQLWACYTQFTAFCSIHWLLLPVILKTMENSHAVESSKYIA